MRKMNTLTWNYITRTLEGDPYTNREPVVTDDANGNITIEALQ